MMELKTRLLSSLVCKGSSCAKVIKKMDVKTNVLTFVKNRTLSAVFVKKFFFPLMTNILSGAGYKSDQVKVCMLLRVKTLSGAGYLSDVWMQICFLNFSEGL